MSDPIRVLVTGPAGQIGYSLVYMIAHGDVFGPQQRMILHLLDIEPCMPVLQGVCMELQDCAFPLVLDVIATSDPKVGFKDIDAGFLVGAFPRKQGMERKDLLARNCGIFKEQGKCLNELAKKTAKICVVGNPANTNALILKHFAPDFPAENVSAMTRLDQNRAYAQIGARVGVPIVDVENVFIWGNHSATQYPDVNHATVKVGGQVIPVRQAVKDDNWLNNEFIELIQKRGAAVIKQRGSSSAMSAAKAVCDHIHDWWFGTPQGHHVSMAVVSDGSYGVEKGLVYSFPVDVDANRQWKIVQGLTIDDFSRAKMDASMKELIEERDQALSG